MSLPSNRVLSVDGYAEAMADLNRIMTILGTTKASLWPFRESTGTLVTGLALGDLTSAETAGAAEALEDDFAPWEHNGGFHSYHFHPTGDHHLAGIDDASFSFGDASVDAPFSVGAWILPAATASNTIIAMYDSAGNKEEFRFWIDASSYLNLELHDASASTTEIAHTTSALSDYQWQFVVATYDGAETAPEVLLYVDGSVDNDGITAETGAYVAMEDVAALLTIGCSGVTALPVNEFHGRIALPFICGKELTAANVTDLYRLTRAFIGV